MLKMNFSNRQTTFEYALYEIAASCFKRTNCVSYFEESKMRIQFTELKKEEQYMQEEICIAYMEKLFSEIPSRFWEQEMEVQLLRNKNSKARTIYFISKDKKTVFTVSGKFAGKKNTQIRHGIWVR